MRVVMTSLALAALCACNKPADTNVAMDANMDHANMAMAAPMQIKATTWELTDNGKAIQESIDGNGNYIATSGTEHIDHGTARMVDGKPCFTSAMNKDGEICWTNPNVEIGQSAETTSDKGQKLTVKRVEYVEKTM